MILHYGTLVILLCIQNTATQNLFDMLGGLGLQSGWNQPGPAQIDARLSMLRPSRMKGRAAGGKQAGGPPAAPATTSPFGATEEQMAEILSESAKTDPERQRIDKLIQSSGGKFTGKASPLNHLIQDYLATPPPIPSTEPPMSTPSPKPKKGGRRKASRLQAQMPMGSFGAHHQQPGSVYPMQQPAYIQQQQQQPLQPPAYVQQQPQQPPAYVQQQQQQQQPQQGHFPQQQMMHPQSRMNAPARKAPRGGQNQNNMWPAAALPKQPQGNQAPGPQRGQQSTGQYVPKQGAQGSQVKFGPPPPSFKRRQQNPSQNNGPMKSGLMDGRVKMRSRTKGKSIAAERLSVIQKRIDSMTAQMQRAAGKAGRAQLENMQNDINALSRLQDKLRGGSGSLGQPAPQQPAPQSAPSGTVPYTPPYNTNTGMDAAFIDHNFRQTFGTMMSQAVQGKQPGGMGGPPGHGPHHGFQPPTGHGQGPAPRHGQGPAPRQGRKGRKGRKRARARMAQSNQPMKPLAHAPAHGLPLEGGIEIAPPIQGSTLKPPVEGDVRYVHGVKYVYADADGFEVFQWVKAPPGTPAQSTSPIPQGQAEGTQPPA